MKLLFSAAFPVSVIPMESLQSDKVELTHIGITDGANRKRSCIEHPTTMLAVCAPLARPDTHVICRTPPGPVRLPEAGRCQAGFWLRADRRGDEHHQGGGHMSFGEHSLVRLGGRRGTRYISHINRGLTTLAMSSWLKSTRPGAGQAARVQCASGLDCCTCDMQCVRMQACRCVAGTLVLGHAHCLLRFGHWRHDWQGALSILCELQQVRLASAAAWEHGGWLSVPGSIVSSRPVPHPTRILILDHVRCLTTAQAGGRSTVQRLQLGGFRRGEAWDDEFCLAGHALGALVGRNRRNLALHSAGFELLTVSETGGS